MARRAGSRRATRVGLVATLALAVACNGGKGPVTAAPGDPRSGTTPPAGTDCNWAMWGQNPSRTFSYPCATGISPTTAKGLSKRWFFNAADVVTATPAVVDGTLYVGDWSARFYAIDTESGTARWTFQADLAKNVYAGQIVSSAAVADVGGVRTVFFGDGPTLYALRADNGELRWKKSLGTGKDDDFTEIESSPVVVDGKVIFGTDVHNHEDQHAGVHALDAATGELRWTYDPDEGSAGGVGSGCVDVWGSVAVDTGRRAVYVGTGSCDTKNVRWQPTSEAVIAIDLDTGKRRWVFQPHSSSRADLDFAGAPNLFDANGRAVVGLGNKDGTYYALDRDTGAVVWKAGATQGGPAGGFIGPTAYARGIIAGGTAVGSPPFVHGINAEDGTILWQNPKPQASYAASAEANGVLFLGGIDFTFRALDLKTGEILWSQDMPGGVAGGAVVVGDDVYAVNGLREPGQDTHSTTSGVTRFSLHAGPSGSGATTSTTAAPGTTATPAAGIRLDNAVGSQPCIGAPCAMTFLNNVPAGLSPTISLEVTPDPFRITVTSSGLGEPTQWLKAGSVAADEGAKAFALFASESDETLQGGLVCVLDAAGSCTADALPRLATYNRLTLLAVNDTSGMPTPSEGISRLVVTRSFEPPLTPKTTS